MAAHSTATDNLRDLELALQRAQVDLARETARMRCGAACPTVGVTFACAAASASVRRARYSQPEPLHAVLACMPGCSNSAKATRQCQADVYISHLDEQLVSSRGDCARRLREREEYFTLERFENACLSLAEMLEADPHKRLEETVQGVWKDVEERVE